MKVGDTVRLRSGGPLMTVKEVYEKTVDVIWFPTDEESKEETFSMLCIELDTNLVFR